MKLFQRLWLFLALFCCANFTPAQSQTDSRPRVTIDSGTLEGAHFGSSPNEVMFLGIPYAAPPTGDLRWKPPSPVEKWQGIRKADAYGPVCPQAADPHQDERTKEMVQTVDPYYSYREGEDCLYLNVWTTNLPLDEEENVGVNFRSRGRGIALTFRRDDDRRLRVYFGAANTPRK